MTVKETRGDKLTLGIDDLCAFETTRGTIKAELYPEIAPNTVNNFISLIQKGFYDGTIFHRVIPGFMIQGGDPEGTGMGGPGYGIKGEFATNAGNAAELLAQPDVDGGLIGGASLKPNDFAAIVDAATKG